MAHIERGQLASRSVSRCLAYRESRQHVEQRLCVERIERIDLDAAVIDRARELVDLRA